MPCFFKKIATYKGTHHLGRCGILHLFYGIICLQPQPADGQMLSPNMGKIFFWTFLWNRRVHAKSCAIGFEGFTSDAQSEKLTKNLSPKSIQGTTSGRFCLAQLQLSSKNWYSAKLLPKCKKIRSSFAHRQWKLRSPNRAPSQRSAACPSCWTCPLFGFRFNLNLSFHNLTDDWLLRSWMKTAIWHFFLSAQVLAPQLSSQDSNAPPFGALPWVHRGSNGLERS